MFSGVACLFLICSWCVGEIVGVVLGSYRLFFRATRRGSNPRLLPPDRELRSCVSTTKDGETVVIDLAALTPEDPGKPHDETQDRAHSGPSHRRELEAALHVWDAAYSYLADPTPDKLEAVRESCAALVTVEPKRCTV